MVQLSAWAFCFSLWFLLFESLYPLPGFCKILVEGQGALIEECSLLFMAGGLIAAAYPEISVGIGIGNLYDHLEYFQGFCVFALVKEHHTFFKVSVCEFPVAPDTG